MQPARAAKVMNNYVKDRPPSDDMFSSDFECEGKDTGHDSDENEERNERIEVASSQPTRRSRRTVNKDVVYNTSIHPQDAEIEEVEKGDNRLVSQLSPSLQSLLIASSL